MFLLTSRQPDLLILCFCFYIFNDFPLGAWMFQRIEENEARTKYDDLNKKMVDLRTRIAGQLWNLTCCDAIGYDKQFYSSE